MIKMSIYYYDFIYDMLQVVKREVVQETFESVEAAEEYIKSHHKSRTYRYHETDYCLYDINNNLIKRIEK